MSDKYLAHYGTKGQKKGIRNHQSYETAPTRSGMVGEERGDAAKQRVRLTRDEKKLAKNYDIETSKAYLEADANHKIHMSNMQYNLERLYGRKAANKMMYKLYEKGADLGEESRKQLLKRMAAGGAKAAAVIIAAAKLPGVLDWYKHRKSV